MVKKTVNPEEVILPFGRNWKNCEKFYAVGKKYGPIKM